MTTKRATDVTNEFILTLKYKFMQQLRLVSLRTKYGLELCNDTIASRWVPWRLGSGVGLGFISIMCKSDSRINYA